MFSPPSFKSLTKMLVCLTVWSFYAIVFASASLGSSPSGITKDVAVEPDRPLFASCYSIGRRITDIYWSRPDGQRVKSHQGSKMYVSQENRELLLVILQVGEADEGEYTCQEIGDGGETTLLERFSLRVLAKSEPIFEKPYEVVDVYEGVNLTLICEAAGDQPINYTWLDQHSSIITNSSLNTVILEGKGRSELYLPGISTEASGVYTCVANNHLGTDSKLFELVVHKREDERPPVFDETRVNVYGTEDERLTLDCKAEGNPRPTYVWYNKYGEKLDRFHQRVIDLEIWNHSLEIPHKRPSTILVTPSNGTLVFVQLKSNDAGHYTCYAQNSAGRAAKTYRIYVNETEDGLTGLVRNVTHNSVTFELIFKDDFATRRLEVKYTLQPENPRFERNVTTMFWQVGDEYKVTGLLSGAKYSFEFRILPNGNWTVPITVALPPGPPEIIVKQVAQNKLSMEFFRPFYTFAYNSIERYLIKYRTVQMVGGNTWNYRDCEVTINLPSCHASSYEISNLASRVYYSITVQAIGPGGKSEPSEMKIFIP